MIRTVLDYSMTTPSIDSVTPSNLVEDAYYTNQTRVEVAGTIDGAAQVEVYLDGELYDTVTANNNSYKVGVRVNEGDNLIKVRARVNDQLTTFSPEINVILNDGRNDIEIVATDKAGNQTVRPLQVTLNQAPLLLSAAKELPAVTLQAMKDFGAKEVVIVGGELAVSTAVEASLKQAGLTVTRITGSTRYETNIKAYEQFGQATARGAIVASGETFADALCGGAFAAMLEQPLVLTQTNQLPTVTTNYLTKLNLAEIIILGGNLAVSSQVESTLVNLLD